MREQLERMRAIVAQAVAEAQQIGSSQYSVHLVVYGRVDDAEVTALFEEAGRGTSAEGARLVIEHAGSRYICWVCCGLRFESADGVCLNCGELAFEVPEDISYGLRQVVDEG